MNKDTIALIRDRYGFEFPDLYRTLREKGHFSTKPWENYLNLHECEWLSLGEIATYEFLDFQITSDGGFVPFGITARRDEWCWRLDWAVSEEPPIVFCERGESGSGYAPNFQGFLYRIVLEEFAGFGGPENERGLQGLRRTVAHITPFLPQVWAERLRGLGQREFGDWKRGNRGEIFLLGKDELEAVINAELAFPHLNETFTQDKGRAKG